jgi:hypothetical protein
MDMYKLIEYRPLIDFVVIFEGCICVFSFPSIFLSEILFSRLSYIYIYKELSSADLKLNFYYYDISFIW